MNNTFITGPARGAYIPTIKKKDTMYADAGDLTKMDPTVRKRYLATMRSRRFRLSMKEQKSQRYMFKYSY